MTLLTVLISSLLKFPVGAEEFLKKAFSWHYKKAGIKGPPAIPQREFGTGSFGKKIDKRHISFSDEKALNSFLVQESPMFISYSCAYYEKPGATPMAAKGFLGADLVYEFDADDFNGDCASQHDLWNCRSCGAKGKGSPKNCPDCGSTVNADQWFCGNCLGKAKEHVFKLLGFLENDFGIREGISINFSGSKGYHIHVRSPGVRSLSHRARVELVDYLTGSQLKAEALGFYSDKERFYCPKESNASGWSAKILKGIKGIFERQDANELAVAGSTTTTHAKKILNESDLIYKGVSVGYLPSIHKNYAKFWNSVITYVARKEALPIDRQTSVDIVKIVRVPDTLHGSTGLKASEIKIDSLKQFDPLKDSIVFSERPVKVKIKSAPQFCLNEKRFGPYREQEAELPMYAGIYLLARGSAELAGDAIGS